MIYRLLITIALLSVGNVLGFAQDAMFVPHIVDGQLFEEPEGFSSEIFILNPNGESVTVTVTLTADDGEPMRRFADFSGPPAGETAERTLDLSPRGSASLRTITGPFLQIGWARLEASQHLEVVTNIRFGLEEAIASAGVPAGTTSPSFLSVGQISGEAGSTGLAILNTAEVSTELSLTLRSRDGSVAGQSVVSLGARGKIVQFLNEPGLFPELQSFRGVVEITADQPLSVMAIEVEELSWTTFPPVPVQSQN